MERVQNLAEAVRELRSEGAAIRRELRRRTTLLGWMFAGGAVILACALLAAYTVSLDNQAAIDKSNKQWCPLVGLLIPKPDEAKATTPRGKQLEENARELYSSFGCGVHQ